MTGTQKDIRTTAMFPMLKKFRNFFLNKPVKFDFEEQTVRSRIKNLRYEKQLNEMPLNI